MRDGEDLALRGQRARIRPLLQVRAVATILSGDFHALGILTHDSGKGQELQGLVEGDLLQRHGLEQRRRARLFLFRLFRRLRLAVLVILDRLVGELFLGNLWDDFRHVGSETAILSQDGPTVLRILAEFTAVRLTSFDQLSGLFSGEFVRCEVVRHIGTDGIFNFPRLLVDAATGFQVRPISSDPERYAVGNVDRIHRTGIDLPEVFHDRLEAAPGIVTEIEPGEPVDALGLAPGNAVEIVFHRRGELVVHVLGEVLLQQTDHGERRPGRHERTRPVVDVSTVHDRRNDRGIGRRTPDAQLVHGLNQGSLRVARGRRGLVTIGLDIPAGKAVPFLELRKPLVRSAGLGVLSVTSGVFAFLIRSQEAAERDHGAGGGEFRGTTVLGLGFKLERSGLALCIGHLRGDRALPNEFIQSELILRQLLGYGRGRPEGVTSRADGFVSLLCILRFGCVKTR